MKKKIRIKKEKDYEIPFWREWLEADSLQRELMVKKLALFNMALQMKDTNMWRHSFAGFLNSSFQDLESACYTKFRLDAEKEKNCEGKNNLQKIYKFGE